MRDIATPSLPLSSQLTSVTRGRGPRQTVRLLRLLLESIGCISNADATAVIGLWKMSDGEEQPGGRWGLVYMRIAESLFMRTMAKRERWVCRRLV